MEDSSNQLKQQKNKTGFRMEHWMQISVYLIIFVTAVRFSYRSVLLLRATRDKKEASRIMLIGMYSKIGTS